MVTYITALVEDTFLVEDTLQDAFKNTKQHFLKKIAKKHNSG